MVKPKIAMVWILKITFQLRVRKDHSFDDDELGQNNFQSKHLPTSEVVQDSPVIGRRATKDFQLRVRKGQVKCFSPDFTPVIDQEAFFCSAAICNKKNNHSRWKNCSKKNPAEFFCKATLASLYIHEYRGILGHFAAPSRLRLKICYHHFSTRSLRLNTC